jgi:hypothetical protein
MGFVVKSMALIAGISIIYIATSILHEGGLDIFGRSFYTEIGFYVFVMAIFLDTTFSFHKW